PLLYLKWKGILDLNQGMSGSKPDALGRLANPLKQGGGLCHPPLVGSRQGVETLLDLFHRQAFQLLGLLGRQDLLETFTLDLAVGLVQLGSVLGLLGGDDVLDDFELVFQLTLAGIAASLDE